MKSFAYLALLLVLIQVYAEFSAPFYVEASQCYICVKDCSKGCTTSVQKNQFPASKNVRLCKSLCWERCNCARDKAQYRESYGDGVFSQYAAPF
mmetsp:Transcript_48829/g.122859  ORF Transcript_48829/g.122859 Transcript_48829/m.122859 type:complete len:94 (-) Transcript_48829:265-546(-)|eukprot:CAMPEP_0177640338 /NCGR_PEP_ID=MMETSP0447-20121125/6491_1 /TAXON_ID=0 /ORGANISM="Stygamoeba regulata, Strain BSH-02190019" /LENGTH=93 /DNA_ID=CAMNT_0019142405 /DNA_START=290 /DNA_END=571 /DNA_ORIENTATION=-